MTEDEPFELSAEPPPRRSFPPGPGRPKGSRNKTSEMFWRMARAATPTIMQRLIGRACRLDDEIDFKCAQLILTRTWPRPQRAPIVEIDLSQLNSGALTAAVQSGQLSAAEAATLMRAKSAALIDVSTVDGPSQADARDQLAQRLNRVLEEKRRQAHVNGEAAPPPDGSTAGGGLENGDEEPFVRINT